MKKYQLPRVAFIINPNSAKKNYQTLLRRLHALVENPLVYLSESALGTETFIRDRWEEIDTFVAVGGDGTISSVARLLAGTDKNLAVYPKGSGNGFAKETRFRKNLYGLLRKLNTPEIRQVDTFSLNGQFALNLAGAGFDGQVSKDFELTKRGLSNYVKVSFRNFFLLRPFRIAFPAPYEEFSGEYMMMNVANSRQFGNNAFIAPYANMSDGLAEIVLVKKFPFTYSANFAVKMFTKRLNRDKYIKHFSVSELTIEVGTSVWHLDGEFRALESPVHLKVFPGSLNILS